MAEPITENAASGQFPDCPAFLTAYLRYLELFQDRTKNTVNSAYLTLREFLQYIHYKNKILTRPTTADAHKDMSICNMELREVAAVSRDDINEYLCFLDTVTRNTSGTMRRKLSLIRVFYEYLCDHQVDLGISFGKNPTDKIAVPTVPIGDRKLNLVPQKDLTAILAAIEGENAVRDRAIILLISTTGLTVREVADLNEDSYDPRRNRLITRGFDSRIVALTEGCMEALDNYLQEFRSPLEDEIRDKALFVSLRLRRRITVRCIQKAIAKHVSAAGFEAKGYTAQDLRDTAVVTILNGTPDPNKSAVMEYLGFRSPKSRYRFTEHSDQYYERMADLVRQSGVSDFG